MNILQAEFEKWLKKQFIYTEVASDYISISTPFVDNNYDRIEIFARYIDKNTIELSDFGCTIYNLEELGINCSPKSKKIHHILQAALTDYGISMTENKELIIKTTVKQFPQAKFRMLQGIMRINDLKCLHRNNVTQAFNDIVREYFDKNEILYTPSFEIPVKNEVNAHFDFSVPNKQNKEYLIKTVGKPNDLNAAKVFNYDARNVSPFRKSNFILLLNDLKHGDIHNEMKETATHDLQETVAHVIGMSELEKNKELITN